MSEMSMRKPIEPEASSRRFVTVLLTMLTLAFGSFSAGRFVERVTAEEAACADVFAHPDWGTPSVKIRSMIFSFNAESAILKTRDRLVEKSEGFLLVHSTQSAGRNDLLELFQDLVDMDGIRNVNVFPYTVYLSKADAYTWDEIIPQLEQVVEKHGIN